MSDDELRDVQLQGVRLVAEDPKRWILPRGLTNGEVFEWWENLASSEEQLWSRGITTAKREAILEALETYENHQRTSRNTTPERAKARTLLMALVHHGLNTHQIARLLKSTPEQVMGVIYHNLPLTRQERQARVTAEMMLRDQRPYKEIIAKTGVTRDSLERMRSQFGLPKQNQLPEDVRDRVLDMRRQGMKNREIIARMAEIGVTVDTQLISTWWRRYGREGK